MVSAACVSPRLVRDPAALAVRDQLRDAEVEHLGFDLAAGQQDVLGLEVAVQHALLVRRLDRRADRRQDPHRPRRLEPSFAVQHAAQILAAHQLHHQVRAAAGQRAEVEDRHDARDAGAARRSAPRAGTGAARRGPRAARGARP